MNWTFCFCNELLVHYFNHYVTSAVKLQMYYRQNTKNIWTCFNPSDHFYYYNNDKQNLTIEFIHDILILLSPFGNRARLDLPYSLVQSISWDLAVKITNKLLEFSYIYIFKYLKRVNSVQLGLRQVFYTLIVKCIHLYNNTAKIK